MRPASFLSALLVSSTFACAPPVPEREPEPELQGCTSDADCAFVDQCIEGDCVPRALPSECTTSDDCLEEPLNGIPDIYWDGEGAVCTLAPDDCGPDGCAGRRICRVPDEGATRPGAIGCSEDAQCLSGYCATHGTDRVCVKSCGGDVDCAGADDPSGQRRGDACVGVEVGESSLRACAPALPGRTLCRNDCDCTATDDCAPPAAGEQRCRFPSNHPFVPGCEVAPADAARPALALCDGHASCLSGGCFNPCDSGSGAGALHFCDVTPARCAPPCSSDADCPQRTTCNEGGPYLRIGEWLLPNQKPNEDGRDVTFCQLPVFGCFDHQDCFPTTKEDGTPVATWQLETPVCKVSVLRQLTAPRVVTICQPQDPLLAPPGACCTTNEECDTAICAPVEPGGACPAGVCTVPCDPTHDLDGVPDSGDERDRCAGLVDEPTNLPAWFAGTHCRPMDYARTFTGADGIPHDFTTPLMVCR